MIRKRISHDFNENISQNLHESSMLWYVVCCFSGITPNTFGSEITNSLKSSESISKGEIFEAK